MAQARSRNPSPRPVARRRNQAGLAVRGRSRGEVRPGPLGRMATGPRPEDLDGHGTDPLRRPGRGGRVPQQSENHHPPRHDLGSAVRGRHRIVDEDGAYERLPAPGSFICPQCGLRGAPGDFGLNGPRRRSWCYTCTRIAAVGRSRKYRAAHPGKQAALCRDWRARNPGANAMACRKWRAKQKETL